MSAQGFSPDDVINSALEEVKEPLTLDTLATKANVPPEQMARILELLAKRKLVEIRAGEVRAGANLNCALEVQAPEPLMEHAEEILERAVNHVSASLDDLVGSFHRQFPQVDDMLKSAHLIMCVKALEVICSITGQLLERGDVRGVGLAMRALVENKFKIDDLGMVFKGIQMQIMPDGTSAPTGRVGMVVDGEILPVSQGSNENN